MITGQVGIFALGDAANGFFEFSLHAGADPDALVRAVADLRPPHTTVGGVNFVLGFRPELWRAVDPAGIPRDVHGFDQPVRGAGGYAMPGTQADLFVWYAASSYDIVYDLGVETVAQLRAYASLEREFTGWSYRHNRDLIGFEDGTENPNLYLAPAVALIEDGAPGAGGSVLLFQQWRHDGTAFHDLSDETQELVVGRTKLNSIELDEAKMPDDSHVTRTTVEIDGTERKIFRRNIPYGTVSDHGTLFIGFAAEQRILSLMLEQMAGADGGPRDALTKYTTAVTGSYYFVPAVQTLARFTTPEDD